MNNPRVSIITACYNEEKSIAATIESVLCQTYSNIEYIIVDGNSEDNTMNIVKSYENKIDIIISEQDKGIYDAFNKGISVSSGDIIYFLNADLLYDEKVIQEVVDVFEENENLNLLYGNVELIDEKCQYSFIKGREFSLEYFENGEMIPHQGVFVKKHMFDIYGKFDLNYKICSDFDFVIKCFKEEFKGNKYLNRIIARCREGGISTNYQYNYLKAAEFSYIIHKHFNKLKIEISNPEQGSEGLYRMWLDSILLSDTGITRKLRLYAVNNIAIFGTMKTAMLLYKDLQKENYKPVVFLDNNKNMQGRQIEDIKIYSIQQAIDEKISMDCILVSVENSRDIEIIKSLREDFGESTLILSWKDLAMTNE